MSGIIGPSNAEVHVSILPSSCGEKRRVRVPKRMTNLLKETRAQPISSCIRSVLECHVENLKGLSEISSKSNHDTSDRPGFIVVVTFILGSQ